MEYFLSPDDIQALSVDEINKKLREVFGFDAYRWQKEAGVIIDEPNRAEGLDRILYKCPACLAEGKTIGAGDKVVCKACGKEYFMSETGEMQAIKGETEIAHIPDWYEWERRCVREDLLNGNYRLEDEVKIYALVNSKALYDIGNGKLLHDHNGFVLYGENGEIIHEQKPLFSYSINADFFWYEIGDVVYIGNSEITYCCVPQTLRNVVAKARLATEELYKLKKAEKI
jgi:DNA-directed RNA polymerase subunit RPC12/RpoP